MKDSGSGERNQCTHSSFDEYITDIYRKSITDDVHPLNKSAPSLIATKGSNGHAQQSPTFSWVDPSALLGLSDVARLFFGTNILVFPYIVSLCGAVGCVFIVLPVSWLIAESVLTIVRAKKKIVDNPRGKIFSQPPIKAFLCAGLFFCSRGVFRR